MLTTLLTVKAKTGPGFTKEDFQSQGRRLPSRFILWFWLVKNHKVLFKPCVHHQIFPTYNVMSFLSAYCMKPPRFQRGKDLSQILENLYFCTNSGTNVFVGFMFYISIHLQVISRRVLEDCASINCVVMHQIATLGENIPRSRPAPVNTWLLPLEDRGQPKGSFWISPH